MAKVIRSNKEVKSVKPIKKRLYAKSENPRGGAKSKFDEVSPYIVASTRQGLSKKDRIAGLIHETTYREWLAAGEEDLIKGIITEYSLFSQQIAKAEKEYREELIQCIKEQAPKDWKAANWLLERSDPETYKLKDKVEMKQEVEISQKAKLEIPDNGMRDVKDFD